MISPGETIFYWKSDGPSLVGLTVATLVVTGMLYLAFRGTKELVIRILVSAFAVLISSLIIGGMIWPDEVSISMKEIKGRNNLLRFSIDTSDISSIEAYRGQKNGPALYAVLKSQKQGVGIPVISDQHKAAYKDALHKVCPDAKLSW